MKRKYWKVMRGVMISVQGNEVYFTMRGVKEPAKMVRVEN